MEDYKKKYEAVLNRVKDYFEGKTKLYSNVDETLKYLFPELKESEDERIRKEIIQSIQDNMCVIHKDKCIAWLEKRGEQKLLVTPKFRKGDFIRYKTNPDDVERVDCVMDDYYILDIKDKCIHVLFTCQDLWELVEQKSAWSEEDENMLNDIIRGLKLTEHLIFTCDSQGKTQIASRINWLKSLKERVGNFDDGYKVGFSAAKYNQWKPSDEQIKALLKLEEMHVLEHEKNQENAHLYMVIKSLKEQLFKLKGE